MLHALVAQHSWTRESLRSSAFVRCLQKPAFILCLDVCVCVWLSRRCLVVVIVIVIVLLDMFRVSPSIDITSAGVDTGVDTELS